MSSPGSLPSLRLRLLASTLVLLCVALVLTGLFLDGLFRNHATSQFEQALRLQLDQLTARLDTDAQGQPRIDSQRLSDPRWQTPYSGLYWQIDRVDSTGAQRFGVLRSRSLWDTALRLDSDAITDGQVHMHQTNGPNGTNLLVLERSVSLPGEPVPRWRLAVAGDLQEMHEAADRFGRELGLTLMLLGVLLALAVAAQVVLGLAPLRVLQSSVQDLREGRQSRLDGRFPAEVQPLIEDFNSVLDRNTALVERARAQAGDLAHALKTPMAVLRQAGREAESGTNASSLPNLLADQLAVMQRHVDWHLAQTRAAAAHGGVGQLTDVAPVISGLVRVMNRIYAERKLQINIQLAPGLRFAGESQDLQTLLGNLIDNACKWSAHQIDIKGVSASHGRISLEVQDDGPGIPDEQKLTAKSRGVRMDQSVPGSGLGLAITDQLVQQYGGTLRLMDHPGGGLRVCLELPGLAATQVRA